MVWTTNLLGTGGAQCSSAQDAWENSFAVQRKGTRGAAVFLNFAGSCSSLVSHPQLPVCPCWSPGCPSRATYQVPEPLLPAENGRNSRSLRWFWSRHGLPDFWDISALLISNSGSVQTLVFIFPMLSSLASAPSPLSCAHSVSVVSFLRKKSAWDGQ